MRANIVPAGGRAADLAQATPESRDRYVDFLRLASIVVVVLGHWLMAVVIWHGDGIHTGNVIGMVPRLWLATWVLQVMPIFFFVGGFANLATIDGAAPAQGAASRRVRRRPRRDGSCARSRCCSRCGSRWRCSRAPRRRSRVLGDATKLVCQPLWFIGVYLEVTALAPLHARPARRTHAPAPRRTWLRSRSSSTSCASRGGIGVLGYVNMLFVWLFAQQLGFFYADGTLGACDASGTRRRSRFGALGALCCSRRSARTRTRWSGCPATASRTCRRRRCASLVLAVFQVALVMLARAVSRLVAAGAASGRRRRGQRRHHDDLPVAPDRRARRRARCSSPSASRSPRAGARCGGRRAALDRVRRVPLAGFVALFGRFERPRPIAFVATSAHATWRAGIGTRCSGSASAASRAAHCATSCTEVLASCSSTSHRCRRWRSRARVGCCSVDRCATRHARAPRAPRLSRRSPGTPASSAGRGS